VPLYDFECKKCGLEFEQVRKIADRERVRCTRCGGSTKVLITCRKTKDWFQPHFNEDIDGTPHYIQSRGQLKELCKKNGLYAPYVFGQGWNISEI